MNKRVRFIAFFCSLLAAPALAEELPDLGDPSLATLSVVKEQAIGMTIMHDIWQSTMYVDDPLVQDYLSSLGKRLSNAAPDNPHKLRFFPVRDDTINAFALPGGFIGTNRGLVALMESESELAAVLAHETAHVTQRHLARMFQESKQLQLPALIAAAAAVALTTQNPNAGTGALAATLAANAQAQINFTRAHELEADHIGMQILADAGFDPRKMPVVFERLAHSTRYMSGEIPEFLSTHPVNPHRIADATNRAAQLPSATLPDTLEFEVFKARFTTLEIADPQKRLERLIAESRTLSGPKKIANRYAQALVAYRMQNTPLARKHIDALLKAFPSFTPFLILAAEIDLQAGDSTSATNRLTSALKNDSSSRPIRLYLGDFYSELSDYENAITALKPLVRKAEPDLEALSKITKAYAKLGRNAEVHQHQAEYLAAMSDYRGAIYQLELAQKYVKKGSLLDKRMQARFEVFKEKAIEKGRLL